MISNYTPQKNVGYNYFCCQHQHMSDWVLFNYGIFTWTSSVVRHGLIFTSNRKIQVIDGLMQERCNSIANALELCLSCTNPTIWLLTPLTLIIICDLVWVSDDIQPNNKIWFLALSWWSSSVMWYYSMSSWGLWFTHAVINMGMRCGGGGAPHVLLVYIIHQLCHNPVALVVSSLPFDPLYY